MSSLSNHINELKAAEAFSRQAFVFDSLYGQDAIIRYKRERVRACILRHARPGERMLELNCGSGEDALFFARQGMTVHATDISQNMLQVLSEKVQGSGMQSRVSTELCSFTALEYLEKKGPYHHVYSNFGGLNCTPELDRVLKSLGSLVLPGGTITLVIISPFCLWECLLAFRGKFRTAFRRLFSRKGRSARVEGSRFTCWYYPASFVRKCLKEEFDLISLEGLCTLVPPSYIEGFAEKYPTAFHRLRVLENKWKDRWPWRSAGDYYIITLRKKLR